MAVNPDQLWTSLDKIEQKLLSIVDDFDTVSQAAVAFNGDIAKVLPVQLNASADVVLELVNGNSQNSIKNLKDYIDNIPLGDLRTKSASEAIRNGQATAPTAGNAPTASAVDLTPKANAPQSAIVANESINLDDYKKKPALKESKLNENNEFSFDAISDEVGLDNEGYDSNIPAVDTEYLDDNLSALYSPKVEDEETFSFDDFEKERLADDSVPPSYEEAFSFNDQLFSDPE